MTLWQPLETPLQRRQFSVLKLRCYNKSISGDLNSCLDCSVVEFTAKIRKNITCLVCGTDSENWVYDAESSKL